jgi:dCTP deaminase
MSFWTSQQLEAQLAQLFDPSSTAQVDCNSYTMRIGNEYYVSPTDQTPDPKSQTIRQLAVGETFTIPPGQFALLITDEVVRVPRNAMAFISIKAKIKLRGLINVSGFHVDPGFQGKLVFSVFNASPAAVHLKQGQDCFLIWFATLETDSALHKSGFANKSIAADTVNGIPGELQSLEGLRRAIMDTEKRLEGRINKLEPKQAMILSSVQTLVTIVIAIAAVLLGAALGNGSLSRVAGNLFPPAAPQVHPAPTNNEGPMKADPVSHAKEPPGQIPVVHP